MHSDKEKDSLQELFDKISINTNQLAFDFNDMNSGAGQPALTISAASADTISLGDTFTGAAGSDYNFQYDYTNSINGGYTITTGSGGTGGGYNITTGTGISGIGTILTTGTNPITWADLAQSQKGSLQVKGDAEFDGDVKIKGKSLVDTLEKIEEKLAIFKPNEKLEEKWEELRELRNRYIELEKEIIEKEKMWDILKK